MLLELALLILSCWGISGRELPSFLHLCNRHDNHIGECFTNSIYELMPRLTNGGIPEIDVPSLDPLQFSSIKVDTGNTGSVNLVVNLKNGTVTGLRKMQIKDHVMNLEQVHSTVKLHLPEINIEANYTIYGRILLFELNGDGHAIYNASDLTTDAEWSGGYFTKKGKRYIRLEHIQFKNVQIGKMAMQFDGLFGNNQMLTKNVNDAINANADVLTGELEPVIKTVLSDSIIKYFNRVYRLFPAEQLFPDK